MDKNNEEGGSSIKKTIFAKCLETSSGTKRPLPTKGTVWSHCFDLRIAEDFYICPNDIKLVSSGFAFEIPQGYAILIRERSSSITKYGISVQAGDIDSDYRGPVMIAFQRAPAVSWLSSWKYSWYMNHHTKVVESFYKHCAAKNKSGVSAWSHFKYKLKDALYSLPWGILKVCSFWNELFKHHKSRNKTLFFPAGTALAQMELVRVIPAGFAEKQNLSNTQRGSGGFGSTTKDSCVAKKVKETDAKEKKDKRKET